MGKYSILFIGLLFITSLVEAQYRINKSKYDFRTYSFQEGDRYNPSVALITSLIIPGTGQIVSGEVGRGAAFIGGFLVCGTAFIVGTTRYFGDITHPYTGEGAGLMIAGGFSTIAIYIFGTIDAVRVTKVNNLAFRDKNKTSFIQMSPYIVSFDNEKIPVGLSLNVRF
jgi:hypothetical protein